MSNAILNNVYNHYLTTYAPKSVTQYDTHKRSELRSVYNSIVKLNKESPLYILDTSKDTQEFAVGIKENARSLHNTIASLGGLDEYSLLNKKTAFSSNEEVVSAEYIGTPDEASADTSFSIEVHSLASPQVNLGSFLPNETVELEPDTYSFDIHVNDLNYEFQFVIKENETNKEVQERLSRLINNAGLGLNAQVTADSSGHTSLQVASTTTGLLPGQNSIFEITDNHTSKRSGTVEYFGLDYTASQASNASFLLNGEERSTVSNHFTVGKMYELQLNGITAVEGDATTIGLKTDLDSFTDNVRQLVGGYNSFIKAAANYTDKHPKGTRLVNEMHNISDYYQSSLESMGLLVDEDGSLQLDDNLLKQSVSEDDINSALTSVKTFANSLLRKTEQVSINPMHYADKTIVAYKNPGRNFASPYITSAYSGMMFNSYC